MNIEKIREKASKILYDKEEEELVNKYIDLLEMKKHTEKQLEEINKAISKFEENPEKFKEDTEQIW